MCIEAGEVSCQKTQTRKYVLRLERLERFLGKNTDKKYAEVVEVSWQKRRQKIGLVFYFYRLN